MRSRQLVSTLPAVGTSALACVGLGGRERSMAARVQRIIRTVEIKEWFLAGDLIDTRPVRT